MPTDAVHELNTIDATYAHCNTFTSIESQLYVHCFYYARLSEYDDNVVVVECMVQDGSEYYVHVLDELNINDHLCMSAILCKYGSTLCMSETLYSTHNDKIRKSFNDFTAYIKDNILLIKPRVVPHSDNRNIVNVVLDSQVGFFRKPQLHTLLESQLKFFKWSQRKLIKLKNEEANNITTHFVHINNFAPRNAWHYMLFMNMLHARRQTYSGPLVFHLPTMSEALISFIDSFSDIWGHIKEYEYKVFRNIAYHYFKPHILVSNSYHAEIYKKHCLTLFLINLLDPNNMQDENTVALTEPVIVDDEYFQVDRHLLTLYTGELLNMVGHLYKYLYSIYRYDMHQHYKHKLMRVFDSDNVRDNSMADYLRIAVNRRLDDEFVVSAVIKDEVIHVSLYTNFIESLVSKVDGLNAMRMQTFKQYINQLNERYNPYMHSTDVYNKDSLSCILYQLFRLCISVAGYISILIFYICPNVNTVYSVKNS